MQTARKKDEKERRAEVLRDRIRTIMEEKDLNTYSWARRADITPTVLYNFLQGASSAIEFSTVQKLAEAAYVPLTALTEKGRAPASPYIPVRYKAGAMLTLNAAANDYPAVRAPEGVDPRGLYAVVLDDPANFPLHNWTAFARDEQVSPDSQVGRMAVVKLRQDTTPKLRTLYRGSKAGTYTLATIGGAPETDVQIEWVHPIVYMAQD